MYENQNKHYTMNVFSERNVRNVIFHFLFSSLGKGRGSQSGSHNTACSFYYRDIANLCNRILNIDQLEMKHMLFSGGSIVKLVETLLRTYFTSLKLVTGTLWRR